MTQTPKNAHRARDRLVALSKQYPRAWKLVDHYRAERRKLYPDWPDWCFLPIAAGGAIMADHAGFHVDELVRFRPESLGDAPALVALASWRVSQGIYRFDPALYADLVETPVSGDLPVSVLEQLPEWCVYIETPGRLVGQNQLHGFWAHLEHDMGGAQELRLLLDCEELGLMAFPIHLSGTIDEGIQRFLDIARQSAVGDGQPALMAGTPHDSQLISSSRAVFEPLVSLLLYLCSTNADLGRQGSYDDRPTRPMAKRTRRHGERIFPPDHPKEWDVGVRIGAALRSAYQREQVSDHGHEEPSRKVRPHVRRAHWHTFLSGPRKQASGDPIAPEHRKRELRWVPPIAVNLDDYDSLPSVIRGVDGRAGNRSD